jgi:hypothetical protein
MLECSCYRLNMIRKTYKCRCNNQILWSLVSCHDQSSIQSQGKNDKSQYKKDQHNDNLLSFSPSTPQSHGGYTDVWQCRIWGRVGPEMDRKEDAESVCRDNAMSAGCRAVETRRTRSKDPELFQRHIANRELKSPVVVQK